MSLTAPISSVEPIDSADAPSSALAAPSHLDRLEAESIHILREVAAGFANPVLMYSIGKDSSVLMHLLLKAFAPAPPPIPLLHIDTGWKFAEMIAFRDRRAAETGLELRTWTNRDGVARGVGPLSHGSAVHTDVMKTQALRQALEHWGFDAAIGGARRDEERSRAKERVFSFRSADHRWDPRRQRPELWRLYNTRVRPGESVRVFPLSNWTELDIWLYIYRERIPVPSLYLAAPRPVIERDGHLLVVDDTRMGLDPEELPHRWVRFRTLGCWPLTAAVPSRATTLEAVILEMLAATTSERQGRLIDHDGAASMERKKQEGYF
ncbi:MAG: sulfate adenylyltransferase subunit CysD [Lysobacteraceae bacterium]